MKIIRFMNTELTRVAPDTDFPTLLATHASTETRHTYVTDEAGKLLGVVANLDMMKKLVPSYLTAGLAASISDGAELIRKRFEECQHLTAADIMQHDLLLLNPEDTLIEADVRLQESRYNALPVVDAAGILVGDVGRKEILKHIAVEICGLPATV